MRLPQCENCKKITGGEGLGNMGRGAEERVWGGAFWFKIVHFGVYSDKNSQFSIE